MSPTAGRRARSRAWTAPASFSSTLSLLLGGPAGEPEGFRHQVPGRARPRAPGDARAQERWVIGKVRALAAWYTKGLDGGARFRRAVNQAESLGDIRESLHRFFDGSPETEPAGRSAPDAHLRV